MSDDLIVFSEEQRRAANAAFCDPAGWVAAQGQANYEARLDMKRVSLACELAAIHPEDPDSKRLLAAIQRLLQSAINHGTP